MAGSRAPNVPKELKDWVYDEAVAYGYYGKDLMTKEEKMKFIESVALRVAERFPSTGAWDKHRLGHLVRNLKKERYVRGDRMAAADLADREAAAPVSRRPKDCSRLEDVMFDLQTALIAAARANGDSIFRSSAVRGVTTENHVQAFLRNVLRSSYVDIGSGEIYGDAQRQTDIVVYNTE